jgi:hypothetical protein
MGIEIGVLIEFSRPKKNGSGEKTGAIGVEEMREPVKLIGHSQQFRLPVESCGELNDARTVDVSVVRIGVDDSRA